MWARFMTIVEYWARIRCSRNKAFSVGGNDRRSLVTWSYTFWQESYLLQSQTVVSAPIGTVGTWDSFDEKGSTFGREVCKRNMCNRSGLSSVVNWQRSGTNKWRLTFLPVLTFGISPYTVYERRHIRFYHEYQMTNGLQNLVQVEFSFEGWCRGYSNHLLVCSTNVCRPISLLLTKVLLLISYPINPNSAYLIVIWIPNPYLCFQALVSFS